jgi:hypothetical protein
MIFVLSIIPRSVEVINKNPVFGFDQGREYLMVRDIVVNHKQRLIGTPLGAGSAGLQGIFHGPFYYYFLAIPFALSKGDPNAGVLGMFVIGVCVLIAGFFVGKRVLGTGGGLIFLLLVGISPPIIAQSRFLWSPYPSTLFILLAFYFIYVLREKRRNIVFASFFSAFIYNFEFAIAVPMVICLLISAIFVYRIRKLSEYLLLFLGLFFGFLQMIIFEVRHNFMGLRGVGSYLLEGHSSTSGAFFKIFSDHLGSFMYNFKDSFTFLPEPLISIIGVLLFGLTMYFFFNDPVKKRKIFMSYLILMPFLNFIILLFLRNAVYPYYLYHVTLIYLFFLSYCVIRSFKIKSLFIILVIILSIMTISAVGKMIKMVHYDLTDYGGIAKLKGKVDAIDYIYKDAKGNQFNLLVFSPPVYTYPYDYIIEWYGKKTYGYLPGNERKGTFYLLIEPDSTKPWSYNGWLETVIKSGKVVTTTILSSGFIVQKRVLK